MGEELKHYGVKGMKWGVSKAEKETRDAPNARYSQSKRRMDRDIYGKKGEARINRRMNAGKTHKQAERRELGRTVARGLTLTGAAAAVIVMDLHGAKLATYAADHNATTRGREAAADAMGLPLKPTHGPTYTKPNRKGVYNISSL